MRTEPSGSGTDPLVTVPDTSSTAYATRHPITRVFDAFASAVTRFAGSPVAFGLAVICIVVWIITGPIFHYSDGWQLVINTGTTIVTFLMVFLIQQSQNKDSVALHLKLNELIATSRASNHMIGIEDASEEELRRLAAAYLQMTGATNVKEAAERHKELQRAEKEAKAQAEQAGKQTEGAG